MHIVIIAFGTRGDVQPMIALGRGLQRAGHTVRLLAGSNFAAWVDGHGLPFASLGLDMQAMMTSPEGVAWVQEGNNPRKALSHMTRLMNHYGPAAAQAMWQSSQDADVVISSFTTDALAQTICEKLGVPQISALTQPFRPTRSGTGSQVPLFPQRDSIVNRWFGAFGVRLIFPVQAGVMNGLRADLGLPTLSRADYLRRFAAIPVLHAFSEHVVPHAADWPREQFYPTGYWFLDEAEDHWQPPEALADFLAAGAPPVYIGFGSMAAQEPEAAARLALEALAQVSQRGVIASGWGGLRGLNAPDHVYALDGAPHGWLFPRMAALVHHGGAGTTAVGLRAGKPTLIVPHMADQPFWGRRVHELGVGPKAIPRPRLTAATLAQRIDQMVRDQAMQQRAAALGERIAREDGVARAVAAVAEIMARASA